MDGWRTGREFFSYALTWDDQEYIETMIEAAVASGLPPTAVILDEPDRGWTFMDTRLIKAYHIKQNYGQFPPWVDQSDRMSFEVRSYVSRSAAAMERLEEKINKKGNKSKTLGKKYYVVAQVNDGGLPPTPAEFYEEKQRLANGRD